MKLIAKKPCSFGGEKFYIGDEIPADRVLNPRDQEKLGTLSIVPGDGKVSAPTAESASGISVLIHAEEGDMPLDLTAEGLQSVVDVLTGNAKDADPVIEQMTDGDALILLHLCDGRKSVKAAAENRAKALNEQESEGEQ